MAKADANSNVQNDIMTSTNISASKQEDNISVKKGDKDTLEALAKQPKLPIMIPYDPNNPGDFVVVVNGTIYTIQRNIIVEVPKTIFDIAQESMLKTMQIKQEIKITEQ